MAIFKCKMCGGDLEVTSGLSVVECEYCGTQQTLPKLDDDKKANLYDRAGHFRRNNEFDKAISIYEKILEEDKTDAEAYWSLVLCKYGIEYVEDPSTRKRVPTVNRAQYTSIFADVDYKSALEYADDYQKSIYEAEAKAIDNIQKGILEISQKEEPFDVFICYKETDNNGRRTPDSVLATELYHELTKEGFKVFFSRITLEDKLGTAYEPYIFAALNSAKIMVVIGTKPEYFNAVWVKNEWSRYLALIQGGAKKMLIPAYKDMDPYDLPDEFSHLQAQDMSKLGFMQDLIRGIKKIAEVERSQVTATVVANAATEPLLKRAFLFLEEADWESANTYFERVLDGDPECAKAYVGKLMLELKVKKEEHLVEVKQSFEDKNNYQKALRFADAGYAEILKGYISSIKQRNEQERINSIYLNAVNELKIAKTENEFNALAKAFDSIKNYKDAEKLKNKCLKKAKDAHKDDIYIKAVASMRENTIAGYEKAIDIFQEIVGWKNVDEQIQNCNSRIEALKLEDEERRRKEEEYRIERERIQAEVLVARKKALKKGLVVVLVLIAVMIVFIPVYNSFIAPSIKYNSAIEDISSRNYDSAISALSSLGEYKDSPEKLTEAKNGLAEEYMKKEDYSKAMELYNKLGNQEKANEAKRSMIDQKIAEVQKEIDNSNYSKAKMLLEIVNSDMSEEQQIKVEGLKSQLDNTLKQIQSENTNITLNVENHRNLNVFLSNFSEAFFDEYDCNNINREELISFAFTHDVVNNPSIIEWSGSTMGIPAERVNETLNKYLGKTLSGASAGRWSYDGSNYWTGAATGESYDYFSIALNLKDLKDGTYSVDFNTYYAGYECMDSKYYSYDDAKASSDSNCTFVKSGTATIRSVGDAWQLLRLK